MKNASQDGMGPVCFAKAGKPIPKHDRDLFGFNVALATETATARVRVHIEGLAIDARLAVRDGFAAALGMRLMVALCQLSFTVESPSGTRWFSRRQEVRP